jgi:hypothetical protein
VFQVVDELNEDLNKMHGSSKQWVDLLKVEYTPTDRRGLDSLSEET